MRRLDRAYSAPAEHGQLQSSKIPAEVLGARGTLGQSGTEACGLTWSGTQIPSIVRELSGALQVVWLSKCTRQHVSLADRTQTVLAETGTAAVFGLKALAQIFRPPLETRELARQIYSAGALSTPLLAASGLAIGVVMSMHTRATLERIGAEAMIPAGLAISIIREIGPLTAGLLVAGRVGAGIGAELGGMRVTEQIDALEATAVDSFRYLVVTRVLACMIVMPLLTIIIDFAGIVGGFIAETVITGMSLQLFFNRAFGQMAINDYIPPTLKTIVFGFLIGAVSCYLGYNTTGGAEGVGRASTSSVVLSSLALILADVLLVKIIMLFFSGTGVV